MGRRLKASVVNLITNNITKYIKNKYNKNIDTNKII